MSFNVKNISLYQIIAKIITFYIQNNKKITNYLLSRQLFNKIQLIANACGNNFNTEVINTRCGASLAIYIGKSFLANSVKNWRHTPHGVVNVFSWLPTMAKATNSRCPSLTALHIAVRSAQIEGPYAQFSTLQPVIISPVTVRIAAPTGNKL